MARPWRHRLTDIDLINKKATCSNCGPLVTIKVRRHGPRCYYSYRYGSEASAVPRPIDNKCVICQETSKLAFDHDHHTGEHRGWLCRRCNTTLGAVGDNIELLQAMIDYLQKK